MVVFGIWSRCMSMFGLVCVIGFVVFFFFFKQKTAYEIGTGDWSSDVCSSDLAWDSKHVFLPMQRLNIKGQTRFRARDPKLAQTF